MNFNATVKKYLAGIIILCLAGCSVFAQSADFTADKTGGCSPLDVRFTNTSTGFSAVADYKWDFGNGNTSKLVSPGTTYKEAKTYTVKLTITDAGNTYTKTTNVIVYKTPQVNFDVDVTKGCLPLSVSFTSSSTAGDGTISTYFWDFGDGETLPGSQTATHIYNTPQIVTAGLTVTNSFGCYSTLTKNSIVKVLPSVIPTFNAEKTVLCNIADAAKFTNTSTGPPALSYTWDFGDGQTSTDKEPEHVYNKKGVYTIKLTAKSSEGCSAEQTQNAYINASNFKTDFDSPVLVCENTTATFMDKSSPAPTSQLWMVDGNVASYYSNSQFNYTPSVAGSFKLQEVNTYGTCVDTATKNITVKASPKLDGFIADMQGVCGSPVTVKFKDTSAVAVKWEWDFDNYYYTFNPTVFIQNPSFTYTEDGNYGISLRITNANGCTSTANESISIYHPNAYITTSNGNAGCESLTTTFTANSNIDLKETIWNFGDGYTSSANQPQHTFSTAGNYTITLNYTNVNGCKGVAQSDVVVYAKPVFDFTADATTICGNNIVSFFVTGTNLGSDYYWNFGDNNSEYLNYNYTNNHQYYSDSSYTVKLRITNGTCDDTVTKVNYIKVLPPFPKISEIINTCEGTRGEVTFKETSQKTNKWTWDFGDNSTPVPYTNAQPEIKHTYTATGSYKVVLTATNGQCSVRDSGTAYVLLKQNPLLSSQQTEVCNNVELQTLLSGMETNPVPYYNTYNHDYFTKQIEYGDASPFNGFSSTPDQTWRNSFHLSLNNLDVNKKDIRVITESVYFNCTDTTNVLPLKIKGPFAGFEILNNNVCFKTPVSFKDTSKGNNNVAIQQWEWTYGDGTQETKTSGGISGYKYTVPGSYYVTLKVTDKDGCTASSQNQNYEYVNVKGPKADFSMSPNPVSPGTTVNFNNNSNTSNTDYNDNKYTWIYGDGTIDNNSYYASHMYAESGIDTVKLIAENDAGGCTDTAVQYLYVKNINLAYTYTANFINPGSGCPPVLAKFTNTSVNTTRITWDFGDGGTADNLNYPSHTYEKPGVYKVTLYGYFDNGTMDSTFDFITIKGPYATLKVDKLFSCGAQNITLTAEAKNTTAFTWDFGDGTLLDIPDTFAVHKYLTPGVYTPSLIVKDGSGCSFPFFIDDKIVIDTLHFSIGQAPAVVCDSSSVSFTPDIVSLAKNELQQPLQYLWNFGTLADTAVTEVSSFVYNTPGTYPVTLKIVSPYSCVEQVTDSVVVKQRIKGMISGPSEICEDSYATYTASSNISVDLTWQWQFQNNNSSTQQNPSPQLFSNAGIFSTLLIVNNSGCYDTTYSTITVHAKPAINLSPKQTRICLNDSIQLHANDGINYTWSPADYVSDVNSSIPFVLPLTNTTYAVSVTNSFGCISSDSVTVQVTQPFKIVTNPEVFECKGSSVQLYATGADKYLWIDGEGLSNAQIANPIVKVNEEKNYTVVGYDSYGCFTDTAFTQIKIAELPDVNVGPDVTVPAGTAVALQVTASNNIIKWSWQPADYLNCTNCAAPVSTSRSDITYIAEVTNNYGCTKKDSVTINIICKQSQVYIPTAFTPNGDGKNERFGISGNGIKLIKHFLIFDRWGKAIFEKYNYNSNDQTGSWDGTYNGEPMPIGTYVYLAEIVCDAGEIFDYKGSVTLIR